VCVLISFSLSTWLNKRETSTKSLISIKGKT
jgi:hypothetical protein